MLQEHVVHTQRVPWNVSAHARERVAPTWPHCTFLSVFMLRFCPYYMSQQHVPAPCTCPVVCQHLKSSKRRLQIGSPKWFSCLYFSSRPRSRANSFESFVSAVEEPDDLIKFEDDSVSPSHFVITSPSLVYKYSQHLGQLECLNWNSSLMIPPEQRHFSITNNLKVREECIISVFRGVWQKKILVSDGNR